MVRKWLFRSIVYVCIVALFVGGIGAYGALRSRANWLSVRDMPAPSLQAVTKPEYDPKKPTIAVVLGNPLTEVFDFMVPYEMFAMTGAYNVFAVAPTPDATSLTGGLDLVPHYSFDEVDALLGQSPDLIVVPYMPMNDEAKYRPVRAWLQKHAETEWLSICSGSSNVADAGLLKGRSSTIHWRLLNQVQKKYPDTKWVTDQRYVRDGNMTASAGLTSGIDAVLHVISRDLGEAAAGKIAAEMNYPSYHFVSHPKTDPYVIDRTEAIFYLNLAYQFFKKKAGVLLYDGMEESALTSVFDTYAPLGTTQLYTVSSENRPIVTKHHLNLIARYQATNVPAIDRLFVTGHEAQALSSEEMKHWNEKAVHTAKPEFIHGGAPDAFVFDAVLADLAKQEDVLTAIWAAKRLEYRADHLKLAGPPFPVEAFVTPIVLGLVGLLAIAYAHCKSMRRSLRRFDPRERTAGN
ncbi:hypothetical protein PAESOLCIP111_00422 [Paenibacillus solanacearum]|uniref:DJ-1/PfpI domain-containing protein n=1 Tax=Paenibacillus solanacearum TaxID=2048548 RepID=A0A916JSY1_9BACL|nr:DJ-1/PfpI family protein [Paenibacillus solanacearum]CAG7600728.1 hypothetical protein PAESOLCIP111_00422 [Paenibacillus solanacearum]